MTNKQILALADNHTSAFVLIGFFTAVVTNHFLFPDKTVFDIAMDYLSQETSVSSVEEQNTVEDMTKG